MVFEMKSSARRGSRKEIQLSIKSFAKCILEFNLKVEFEIDLKLVTELYYYSKTHRIHKVLKRRRQPRPHGRVRQG